MKARITLTLLGFLFVFTQVLYAQQPPPTFTDPTGGAAGVSSKQYWSRAGNNNTLGNNNIFGTRFHSPIYTITSGQPRMKLNCAITPPITQYTVNGFGVGQINTTGYLLLGPDDLVNPGEFLYEHAGAFSQLHINGDNALGFAQSSGFRPWMKAGISITDNDDFSYLGTRGISPDQTETIISWSNNAGLSSPGPDDMAFRFISGDGGTYDSDYTATNDLDGLHVARFTPTGELGLGNIFGVTVAGVSPVYYRPQSLLHMSLDSKSAVWAQLSNENGTGQTAQDGLRLGIMENVPANQMEGYLRWQENTSFIIQTDWNNTPGGIANGERMRFTNVGSLLADPDYAGLTTPTNRSRIAISHNGAAPLTRPMSLLHLGYNTGAISVSGTTTDGWRDWMDIGMFVNNGTDDVYIGLKEERDSAILGRDRYDAVIAWGDNQGLNAPLNDGPDKLRFIFAGTQSGAGVTPPANSNDGLETGRFYPGRDTLGTYGRFGVGDFTSAGAGEEPTHKIDVVGNGRFRFLPDSIYMADSLVDKIVAVDSLGVLRWIPRDSLGSGFGSECGSSSPVMLTSDSEVQLNDHNFFFNGGPGTNDINNVGIGTGCTLLKAKLEVVQNTTSADATCIKATHNGSGTNGATIHAIRGGDGGYAGNYQANGTGNNFALYANALGGSVNIGHLSEMESLGATGLCVGVAGRVGNGSTNIGVYGRVLTAIDDTGPDWAGYFNGSVFSTVDFYTPSDKRLKTQVEPVEKATEIIGALKPVTYFFDRENHPNLALPSKRQYGFLSQEVQKVLPELTRQTYFPPEFDSTGNITREAEEVLALNYKGFIALLTQAVQEQQKEIELLKREIEEMKTGPSPQIDIPAGHSLNVDLQDEQSVVLEQNVPNPFAEQTRIRYFIPDEVQDAQIIFYDEQGKWLKSVTITERGSGELKVFGQDLSNGIYTYALVANGDVLETRRMIKSE